MFLLVNLESNRKFYIFRSALEEVKLFSDERLQRWHNIEQICGFPISSNPGKEKLVQILQIGNIY